MLRVAPRVRQGITLPLLAAVGALVVGCDAPAPPAAGLRPVIVHNVGQTQPGADLTYSGEVRARHELPLGFRVPGKLAERRVDVGQTVTAGQVLARLDPADLALSAQGAAATVAAADAEHALARADAERFRELRARNFVSQAALDARETTLRATGERLAAARAQAAVAGNQQTYATLTADAAGVVAAVLAEPGQVLAAGQPVVRLARLGELEVAISVPENQLPAFEKTDALTVVLWAHPDRRYRGRLREIAPQADPVTRTFAARVRVTDADAAVRLGMTATVTAGASAGPAVQQGAVATASPGDSLTIPATALYQDDGRPAVWVIGDDGKVASRRVEVQGYREDTVLLGGGVRAGERIVAAGVHLLHAGEAVQPVGTR